MVDYGKPYDCPHCGHVVEELPDAVTVEVDRAKAHTFLTPEEWDEDVRGSRFVEHTKGHSDQSSHICPECGEEGWRQGWHMEGTHDD